MSADILSEYIIDLLDRQQAIRIGDASRRRTLASACTCLSILGGSTLFREGEDSDSIYIIVAGIMGLFMTAPNGGESLVRRMGAGEIVGEIGFLTGEPRSGTVRALRNVELIKISREALEEASSHCPEIMQSLGRTVVQRLRLNEQSKPSSSLPRALCVVPADPTIEIDRFVACMARTLSTLGSVVVITMKQNNGRNVGWFADLEKTNDYVVLVADLASSTWTQFCLRQCDRILLVVNGDQEPGIPLALGADRRFVPSGLPLDLILCWRCDIETIPTAQWLDQITPSAHYHWRSLSDIPRLTRLVVGRGTGLILSGGGARGLAHIGVIQALQDNHVAIDAIGGTSIGAVIAAFYSLGWDVGAIAKSCVEAFARNRFSDFAIPRIALFSRRKFERTFGQWFGSRNIEDSPIPFFCVSVNLSRGIAETHCTGRLSTWLQASTAIPGVFPPVLAAGALHVDGGVLNNLPVDAAEVFGVGPIIAVDVSCMDERSKSATGSRGALPTMIDLLWRVGTVGSSAALAKAQPRCDILLKPEVANVGLLAWNLRAQAIEAGYRAVTENITEINSIIRRNMSQICGHDRC